MAHVRFQLFDSDEGADSEVLNAFKDAVARGPESPAADVAEPPAGFKLVPGLVNWIN